EVALVNVSLHKYGASKFLKKKSLKKDKKMKRRTDIIMDNALKNVKYYKANERNEEQADNKLKENLALNSTEIDNLPKEMPDINNFLININQIDLPKKDRCDLCLEYEMASVDHKAKLKEKFDTHLKEKDLCRLEKKNDRRNIGEGNICTVYDLQAVMQGPLGDSSSFYYISKLNCLNFTMAELAQKSDKKTNKEQEIEGNQGRRGEDRIEEETVGSYGDVYNYFWDEK
ncbi:unnamed protein product, partial [Parnassius apollo]